MKFSTYCPWHPFILKMLGNLSHFIHWKQHSNSHFKLREENITLYVFCVYCCVLSNFLKGWKNKQANRQCSMSITTCEWYNKHKLYRNISLADTKAHLLPALPQRTAEITREGPKGKRSQENEGIYTVISAF